MSSATGDRGQTRLLQGSPPAALTGTLGVLREPQPEAVELPDSTLARLGFSEVWIDAVRLITTGEPWSMRVYLIPGVSGDGTCSSGSSKPRDNPGELLVSMDIYNPSGRMGATAYSAGQIGAGQALRTYPLPAAGEQQELVLGLVPDGVSSVEVKANDMPAQVVQVRDNFFQAQVLTSQGPAAGVTSVTTTLTWRDAAGRSLRTVSRGSRQATLLRANVEIPGA
jgi:hypothetical protein